MNKIASILILLSILILVSLDMFSQVTEEWVARYNGSVGNDVANAITTDSLGNVYITGYSNGDYATIKYNNAGIQQWVARYNGIGNGLDEVADIIVDSSGNVYVTGESDGGLGLSNDYATIKYNNSGIQQWVARYNGPMSNSNDFANSIVIDNLGNVYVTGGSNRDYVTIKYNNVGIQQWVAIYNGPINDNDKAKAIVMDSSGNVYVTGSSYGSQTEVDYATIKYDNEGVQQWVARYNGPENYDDEAIDIAVDNYGNVYVAGISNGSVTKQDYATVKYNSAGVEQWVARYNGPGNYDDIVEDMDIDSSGNVYVTGQSWGSGTYDDYATIKYNNAGFQQWASRYNSPWNSGDGAYAIALDSFGNVYVTGCSIGSETSADYATIKYNNAGVQQWIKIYNSPWNDRDAANAIALDSFGNVYVTGYNLCLGTDEDYVTIKYDNIGTEQWVARYNGPGIGQDYAKAIAIDSSENIYVTGESDGGILTAYDYMTVKYNDAGVEQWVAKYNGPVNGQDIAYAIALDNLGNVYVTGESYGSGTYEDCATIKYNNLGIEEWVARYNGTGNMDDYGVAIAIDISKNVYVAGYSYGLGANYDYVTIKYNNLGIEE